MPSSHSNTSRTPTDEVGKSSTSSEYELRRSRKPPSLLADSRFSMVADRPVLVGGHLVRPFADTSSRSVGDRSDPPEPAADVTGTTLQVVDHDMLPRRFRSSPRRAWLRCGSACHRSTRSGERDASRAADDDRRPGSVRESHRSVVTVGDCDESGTELSVEPEFQVTASIRLSLPARAVPGRSSRWPATPRSRSNLVAWHGLHP